MTPGNGLHPRPKKYAAAPFLFVVLLVVARAFGGGQGQVEVPDPPPNIILVMADDLGYGDLGINGSGLVQTPHLDQMAEEGVRLTSFFSSANVCTPSRAGLLTGRYAIRMGLAHGVIFPRDQHGIPVEEVTLAEALREVGYRTACIGKWHLGHVEPHWPTSNGFDYYYGLPYSNDMLPLALYRGKEKVEEPVNQSTLTERYTEEAIRFIEENRDNPFFIYLPHTMPHIPLFVSDRFSGQSQGGLYGDIIETIDWSMGQILEALRRRNLDQRTIVIFTSDNGPWYEGSSGAFRDRKGSSWEGGYRVPFIARWPGHIPPGTVSNAIAMGIDVFPTLTRLAGWQAPDSHLLDGRDFWAVLIGSQFSPHEVLYFFTNNEIAAVRTQRWKLVVSSFYRSGHGYFDRKNRRFGPYWLLFDMERDPGERYSLAVENSRVLERMRDLLQKGRGELESLAVEPYQFTMLSVAPVSRHN
jgi:uncharacterized sulfatase